MLSTFEPAVGVSCERTDEWLRRELYSLWDNCFQDIPMANEVDISFDRAWKLRLGLIRLSENGCHTYIGINRLLRNYQVPNEVVSIIVAHELVHYSHGFGSPLPRKYRHPHYGNVVGHELVARGLSAELQVFKDWTSNHWYGFYYASVPQNGKGHGNDGYSGNNGYNCKRE